MLSVRGKRKVMERTSEFWRLTCGHTIVPSPCQRRRTTESVICKECRKGPVDAKKREGLRLKRRREMGRCWNCEEPAAEGRTHCTKHLEYMARKSRERTAQSERPDHSDE